ncbi:MAG: vWA domain-containing protein [Planctomycetaceae bacterium]
MGRFLEYLFGLDRASLEGSDAAWSLNWLALPTGDGMLALLAGLLVGLVAIVLLYRWDAGRHSRLIRYTLTTIRVLLLLLVVVMLLEPVLIRTTEESLPSHLIVLVDQSPSMDLRDSWADEATALRMAEELKLSGPDELRKLRRLDLATRGLSPELLEQLSQQGDRIVHLHTFSERLSPEALQAATLQSTTFTGIPAAGESTAIGAALRQVLSSYQGQPVAGVLLLTDGRSTAGEAVSEVVETYRNEKIPIVGVPMGTRDGPRNVAITKLEVNPVALVRDENTLTVHVESRGLRDVPTDVLLERRRNGGVWEEIGQRPLILGIDGAQQQVDFTFQEERPATLEFRATLSDVGPELTTDDNSSQTDVRVVRDRMRVLFIAGTTFPEVQFLRNTLYRDQKVELSSWLMAADDDYEHLGDIPIRRLPVTQEELNDYDCVILYDPDPAGWPTNFSELLTKFVAEAGGGLVYIAGEQQTANSFDQQNDPTMSWIKLLPVIREPGLFRSDVLMKLSARSPWQLEVTDAGQQDVVFTFQTDREANRQVLENLPGMYWHFPVTRAKPGASVLGVHGDPRMRNEFGPEVLLATHRVGPGRVFFLGFDSTYRWRFLDESHFDGFWARMIDRAGRNKQLGGTYPVKLSTPLATYPPGATVRLIAHLVDKDSGDVAREFLTGQVEHGSDEPMTVTLTPTGAEGEYATTFVTTRPGRYSARVWMGDDQVGTATPGATLAVDVRLPNEEYDNPTLDRGTLEQIASGSGGRVVELTELAEANRHFPIGRISRQYEQSHEIWHAPLWWVPLFALLCLEWILRKRYRLI